MGRPCEVTQAGGAEVPCPSWAWGGAGCSQNHKTAGGKKIGLLLWIIAMETGPGDRKDRNRKNHFSAPWGAQATAAALPISCSVATH
jgi:hypothetical protein